MPATVTPLLSLISECNATTGWTGTAAMVVDTDVLVQGTGCLSASLRNLQATFYYNLGTSVDLTGKNIYAWMMSIAGPYLGTLAAGGMEIYVRDASGNFGGWAVAGKDTYSGGWKCFVQSCDATMTFTSGAISKTSVQYIGVRFLTTGGKQGQINCFWDAMRYGTGLRITGGTSGSPGTFADIYNSDVGNANNMYGVVSYVDGVYFVQGELIFGSSVSGDTYFNGQSSVVVFQDRPVTSGLYKINGIGNATGTTSIKFGIKSGDNGISGVSFRSSGSNKFTMNFTDQYITEFGLYGCNIFDAGAISLPDYNVNKEVLSTIFSLSGEVIASTCIVKNCIFVSSPGSAIRMSGENHNISFCDFIDDSRGVNITSGSTFAFNGLIFSDCVYDVVNGTGNAIVINCTNLSNPSTVENNNASIVSSATLRLTGIQANTEVRVYDHGTGTELAGTEDVVGGTFEWTYNPSTYSSIDIQILHIGFLAIWYDGLSIGSGGLTIPIIQQLDRQYENP